MGDWDFETSLKSGGRERGGGGSLRGCGCLSKSSISTQTSWAFWKKEKGKKKWERKKKKKKRKLILNFSKERRRISFIVVEQIFPTTAALRSSIKKRMASFLRSCQGGEEEEGQSWWESLLLSPSKGQIVKKMLAQDCLSVCRRAAPRCWKILLSPSSLHYRAAFLSFIKERGRRRRKCRHLRSWVSSSSSCHECVCACWLDVFEAISFWNEFHVWHIHAREGWGGTWLTRLE